MKSAAVAASELEDGSVQVSGEGFAEFISDLRAAGYPLDVTQITAAYHVLLLAVSGAWPGANKRLANLLAPIFCESSAQEVDLRRRLEKSHNKLFLSDSKSLSTQHARPNPLHLRELMQVSDSFSGAVSRIELEVQRGYVWRIALALIGVLGLSLGAAYWWSSPPAEPSVSTQGGTIRPAPNPREERQSPPSKSFAPSWAVALPVGLSALPIMVALAWWAAGLRRRLLWSRLAATNPRDLAAIRILVPDTPMFESLTAELAVRDFTRQRRLRMNEPDIDRSCDATVRAAGLATFVMRERPITPEYVILIEEAGTHDHLARLGDLAAERLEKGGLLAARYYISTPRLVRDARGKSVFLEDLPVQQADRRLLIIGPGEAITDQRTGRLASPLLDSRWAERGVLVAGMLDLSTTRRLMEAGFALVPATSSGMRLLAAHLAADPAEVGSALTKIPGVTRVPESPPVTN